ncbi:MAG: methyltransferase type 11 [Candidatus Magnetoglobus multicellularis str. Araruama]|uniref:Methyltransferase type 11 n=1 Tax=Candidatus Magnetoglobus multicellularis str. Araruama TaxID=890399 RepID=A0A1V1P6R8_9BACT|nr:MAG: methyltransferase type 11 [Candidatus Magnetoglobus multicellularis str. Araruama]
MSLKSFYNQRYSLKLNNNIHRIKEIRIIDNLYYYKFIKNELKKCKCKGKNIIDIGCGIADHLKYLEKNSIAIDISEIALSNCNVNNRIVADVTYLPIKSGSIDVTLCIEMIEHLKIGDQVKAIAEICRISNHNRLILISVPNESFHTCIICRIVNKLFKDSGHIGSFNKEKLFNLLNIQGFNNIKIYTHGFFL